MFPVIPHRDLEFMRSVARYDTLTRSQITNLHLDLLPGAQRDRVTRRRLGILVDDGMLNVTTMRTVSAQVNFGLSSPVYYMSARGAEYLAETTGENTFRLCNTTTPHHLYLYHFLAVADTHILLRRACKLLGNVEVAEWIGERAIANPSEKANAEKRYRLYVRFNEKLVCVPDAGFLLQKGDFSKVFYLEQDRDSTKNAERVAAQKCNGYAALAEREVHLKRHFPAASWKNFNVLCIAPTPRRRDNLRKAIISKPLGGRWKFASLSDLRPETFLSEPVWYQGESDTPGSLLVKEST